MKINELVYESYIEEKTFRNQMVRRSAASQRSHAIGAQMRSLAKSSPNRKRISMIRAQLKKLLDAERRQYASRARSNVMSRR